MAQIKDKCLKQNVWVPILLRIHGDKLTLFAHGDKVLECTVGGFGGDPLQPGGFVGLVSHQTRLLVRRSTIFSPTAASSTASPTAAAV